MYVGKYLFRFDDAILLGCCAGARTTTAALGMINDRARSHIPGLGYTVTYAVANPLLTIWGMVPCHFVDLDAKGERPTTRTRARRSTAIRGLDEREGGSELRTLTIAEFRRHYWLGNAKVYEEIRDPAACVP